MNAATGTVLVLPARAADLKRLHAMAAEQLGGLLQACGIGGALAEAGLDALREPFPFARHGNRSLVAPMNHRRHEAWPQFAYNPLPAFAVAPRMPEPPCPPTDPRPRLHLPPHPPPAPLPHTHQHLPSAT